MARAIRDNGHVAAGGPFGRQCETLLADVDVLSGPLERAGGYIVRGRPGGTPNHHLFAMVLASARHRDEFIARMRAHGIVTPFHLQLERRRSSAGDHAGPRDLERVLSDRSPGRTACTYEA